MAATDTAEPKKEASPLSKLKPLGIRQAKHLPLFIPRAYDDYTNLASSLAGAQDGDLVSFFCTVAKAASMVKDRNDPRQDAKPYRYTIDLTGADGRTINAVAFGKLGFGNEVGELQQGQKIIMKLKLSNWQDKLQYNILEVVPPEMAGRIVPVYPSRKGVASGALLREMIGQAIADPAVLDGAVNEVRRAFDTMQEREIVDNADALFPSVRSILQAMHEPESMEEAEAAVDAARRISVCEILWRAQRAALRPPVLRSSLPMLGLQDMIRRLPFTPTGAQAKAITDISTDISSPFPMRRLLSGDVGTGKTAAYGLPAAAAWLKGARVAIMIPNQLLMSQVAKEIRSWFPEVDVQIVCDGVDTKKIDMSNNPLLIGTTSLIGFIQKQKATDDAEPWRPDLLIVDEQQKMSREQRESIMSPWTNFLEATATCLPRTAALVSHGDMKVSILNEFPVKKEIRSHLVTLEGRNEMLQRMHQVVASGQQAALIYPKVANESEKDSAKSVEAAYLQWDKKYPGQVAMLHGKMKDADKIAVMERMERGDFRLLISSTVIEIGITIPALRFLGVVHPERYGSSTLHQLRGRVARKGGDGDFYMFLPEPVGDETVERLKLVRKYNDGFLLAEKDMELRGFGDLSADSDDQAGMSASGVFLNMKITPSDMSRFHVQESNYAPPAEFVQLASGRKKVI